MWQICVHVAGLEQTKPCLVAAGSVHCVCLTGTGLSKPSITENRLDVPFLQKNKKKIVVDSIKVYNITGLHVVRPGNKLKRGNNRFLKAAPVCKCILSCCSTGSIYACRLYHWVVMHFRFMHQAWPPLSPVISWPVPLNYCSAFLLLPLLDEE